MWRDLARFGGRTLYKAVKATTITAGKMAMIGYGIYNVAKGIVTDNQADVAYGEFVVKDKLKEIGRGVVNSYKYLGNQLAEAVDSLTKMAECKRKGDYEGYAYYLGKAKRTGVNLVEAAAIAAIAITPLEAMGVVDIIPGEAEAAEPPEAGPVHGGMPGEVIAPDDAHGDVHTQVLTEGQGTLYPDLPSTEYDADGDGFADPGTVDELVEAGLVDDAYPVDDPPRNPAAVEEFLRQHGLDRVPEGYEVHHIVPLYAGGADSPDNMILVKVVDHDAIHQQLDAVYRQRGIL
ncbi:MAG: HNH endonuclease [Firmicutes bacterium]|nr:HNH endonuclease [Bacillota bacterium]